MNSSGSSFKAPQSTEVRAGAQEDLDKISLSSSRSSVKKKAAPRTLKPLPPKHQNFTTDVVQSGSL